MKAPKAKKPAPSAPKKDVKETLSKKGEETNLKRKNKEDTAKKRQGRKDRKANKDPNKPKRPPSAFFVFLEDFRKTYQAEHPGIKSVAAVGKAGGDKWKSLSEAEKAPFVAKAARRKADYDKSILAYNEKEKAPFVPKTAKRKGDDVVNKQREGVADESDKSKSEINDDEEGSDEELEEEEEDEEE